MFGDILGEAENLLGSQLSQSSGSQVHTALGSVLSELGSAGLGQSVAQAAGSMTSDQKSNLVSTLGQAIEQNGGSLSGVLSSLGIGGGNPGNMGASELGSLAAHVMENHGGALHSLLSQQASSGNSGMLSLLGNPVVSSLASKLGL